MYIMVDTNTAETKTRHEKANDYSISSEQPLSDFQPITQHLQYVNSPMGINKVSSYFMSSSSAWEWIIDNDVQQR